MTSGVTPAIVIVSYNSSVVLPGCLDTVPAGTVVIVVDNASEDGSADLAAARGARVIRNTANRGFTVACNQGAAAAAPADVLFLNPDARLEPGAMERLAAALAAFPEAGAAGPMLVDETGETRLRDGSALHDRPSGPPLPLPEGICCWPLLTGAALMVRRQAFEAVGGLDEAIFLYHDDDDLSLRLRQAGWSLLVEPAARVFHEPARSSPPSFASIRAREAHALRSLVHVTAKHGRPLDLARLRRKTWRRLALAVLLADRRRMAKALGILSALRTLPARPG
jgi:GT2 family glycosyltransferase